MTRNDCGTGDASLENARNGIEAQMTLPFVARMATATCGVENGLDVTAEVRRASRIRFGCSEGCIGAGGSRPSRTTFFGHQLLCSHQADEKNQKE